MPTIIPGYVYSLFAALAVGVILVASCSLATSGMRTDAEKQQLKNIDAYIAAQTLTLISRTGAGDQNITQYLEIPSQIGNQRFWIRITNDSSTAWVESGFGTDILASQIRVEVPAKVAASGSIVSGMGRALIQCHFENGFATLTLTDE
jgi:hypothetical protein